MKEHYVNGVTCPGGGTASTLMEVVRKKTGAREFYRSDGDGTNQQLSEDEFLAQGGNTAEMAVDGRVSKIPTPMVRTVAADTVELRLLVPREMTERVINLLTAAGLNFEEGAT